MWCSHKPSRSLWGTSCSWQKLLLTKRNSFSPYQSGAAGSAASPTASRNNVCSIESVLIEFTWTIVKTGLRRDEGRWTLHTKHLLTQTQPRLMESDTRCRTLYDCETELYNHPNLFSCYFCLQFPWCKFLKNALRNSFLGAYVHVYIVCL